MQSHGGDHPRRVGRVDAGVVAAGVPLRRREQPVDLVGGLQPGEHLRAQVLRVQQREALRRRAERPGSLRWPADQRRQHLLEQHHLRVEGPQPLGDALLDRTQAQLDGLVVAGAGGDVDVADVRLQHPHRDGLGRCLRPGR
jgi:hypothetical protein